MTQTNRTVIFSSYIVLGLLTEAFAFYLFPFTGLGGLISWPIAIAFSFGFGWGLYKLTKRKFRPLSIGLVFFIFLIAQFILELYLHPQDGGSAFNQLSSYNRAYKNFDEIKFQDFTVLDGAERVVYIYKFRKILPPSIITLIIDKMSDNYDLNKQRRYMLQNWKELKYDTAKLKLIQTDTSLIIIENPSDSALTVKHVTEPALLKNEAGGTMDINKLFSYSVYLDNLKLTTGSEKLFYKYLNWTKKASR